MVVTVAESKIRRVDRAAELIAYAKIQKGNRLGREGYWVPSQSVKGRWYFVNSKTRACTCEDSQRGHLCKHWFAVENVLEPVADCPIGDREAYAKRLNDDLFGEVS